MAAQIAQAAMTLSTLAVLLVWKDTLWLQLNQVLSSMAVCIGRTSIQIWPTWSRFRRTNSGMSAKKSCSFRLKELKNTSRNYRCLLSMISVAFGGIRCSLDLRTNVLTSTTRLRFLPISGFLTWIKTSTSCRPKTAQRNAIKMAGVTSVDVPAKTDTSGKRAKTRIAWTH